MVMAVSPVLQVTVKFQSAVIVALVNINRKNNDTMPLASLISCAGA